MKIWTGLYIILYTHTFKYCYSLIGTHFWNTFDHLSISYKPIIRQTLRYNEYNLCIIEITIWTVSFSKWPLYFWLTSSNQMHILTIFHLRRKCCALNIFLLWTVHILYVILQMNHFYPVTVEIITHTTCMKCYKNNNNNEDVAISNTSFPVYVARKFRASLRIRLM